jgi:surfeit locus 1 family protein
MATVFAVIGIIILIGLGVWQLDRKVWKENLNETLSARLMQAPETLPLRARWARLTQARDEFRRVAFSAEFLPGEEALVFTSGSALRPDVQGPGYWVFAPARLVDGGIMMVNRGFIPLERKSPTAHAQRIPGIVNIVGVIRWPETRGMFTPADDLQGNVWYLRDPHAMAMAKKWDVTAPFYIDQEAPVPAEGWPKPGKLSVNLPNNHLQYAITWFGLALGLAGVYVVWLVGRFAGRHAASL